MFLSSKTSSWLWGPPASLFHGYRVLFLELKWPRRKVRHFLASSTKCKNEWNYICTSPIQFRGMEGETFFKAKLQNWWKQLLVPSCLPDCPFVCTEQLGCYVTELHEIWYLNVLPKIYRENLIWLKYEKIMGKSKGKDIPLQAWRRGCGGRGFQEV